MAAAIVALARSSGWWLPTPTIVPVHLPIHASWLNQVEISFSVLERKVLMPADTTSLDALAARILAFQAEYARLARPFEWQVSRADLTRLLHGLAEREASPSRRQREYITEYPGQST
jgi:transposase